MQDQQQDPLPGFAPPAVERPPESDRRTLIARLGELSEERATLKKRIAGIADEEKVILADLDRLTYFGGVA